MFDVSPPSVFHRGSSLLRAIRSQRARSKPAIDWAKGPGSAQLDCQHAGPCRKEIEGLRWGVERSFAQGRRKHGSDQSCTMLRADCWEIAPYFAPSDCAVHIFYTGDDHRPITHRAERRLNWNLQRISINQAVRVANVEASVQGLRSLCRSSQKLDCRLQQERGLFDDILFLVAPISSPFDGAGRNPRLPPIPKPEQWSVPPHVDNT